MKSISKIEQFKFFINKLSKQDVVYSIDLGIDNVIEFKGSYEEINGDIIEGVSERFLGDDGMDYVNVNWKYNAGNIFVTQISFYTDENNVTNEYPEENLMNWNLQIEVREFIEHFGIDFNEEIKKIIYKEFNL